jgi:transposase-like protein
MMICRGCGYQASLTAGTIMHGTHKPLRMWFTAMWWISTQKTGGSAKGLQRLLGLGSYQTAWTWLQKLRRALVRANREPLSGRVEVDEAYLGEDETVEKGRGPASKAKVVVAVETRPDGRGIAGRIRLKYVPNVSQAALIPFVVENVRRGSLVVTDGSEAYTVLEDLGFDHIAFVIGADGKRAAKYLPNVHRMISILKRWLLGTHQGAVRAKHLQYYLDEFAFRQNRRKARHVGKIFYRMVQGSAAKQATPYREIVGRKRMEQRLPPQGT